MRSEETLESFIKHCKDNPQQRFWQALRNWSGYSYVYVDTDDGLADTFYWEGRNG